MKSISMSAICTTFALGIVVVLAGCAGESGRYAPTQQQGVSDVIQAQIDAVDSTDRPVSADAADQQIDMEDFAEQEGSALSDPTYDDADIDIDLTTMSGDMVYATVLNMMNAPEDYEGKVVRAAGPFYHTYYDVTDQDYYYVVIRDAMACCGQGLEFVWGDGAHAYPDEYPQDGKDITITGVFQTYYEDTRMYVHLANAAMELR